MLKKMMTWLAIPFMGCVLSTTGFAGTMHITNNASHDVGYTINNVQVGSVKSGSTGLLASATVISDCDWSTSPFATNPTCDLVFSGDNVHADILLSLKGINLSAKVQSITGLKAAVNNVSVNVGDTVRLSLGSDNALVLTNP